MSFVHLHCHSHYSLLDGASRIPELVAHVKGLGMNAVALTDHGNMFGAIELVTECRKAGLNPIPGIEAYVAPGSRFDRGRSPKGNAEEDVAGSTRLSSYHLTLLARSARGFKNLVKLSSLAYLEGFYGKPRVDRELLAAYSEDVVCLSGCVSSEFSRALLAGRTSEAEEVLAFLSRTFPGRLYVEVQNNGLEIQRRQMTAALDVADRMGLPVVATSDAHYLRREDAPDHDVLLCVNTRKSRSDPKRMRYGDGDGRVIDQFFVASPEQMRERFPGRPDAVSRSQEIADGCAVDIDFKTRHFPPFTPPASLSADDYLRNLCEAGAADLFPGGLPEAHRTRLEYELGVIARMRFAGYFLVVWDFVRYAREAGIPAMARGSAAGALVSYLLYLSRIDPLEHGLLFERFLDPHRAEAPDIDMDFCQDRREEVLAYVRSRYGERSVAVIGTFGTLGAKAAIRDVARALDLSLKEADRLAKLVPAKAASLAEAVAGVPELRAAHDRDYRCREVLDIACRLEGTNRSAGTHAAGVVIVGGDVTDYIPVHAIDGVPTTQWDMGAVEKVGLLKMDFLGLRTLTVVTRAASWAGIDISRIPRDDPATVNVFRRGDTGGVFQFESEGMRKLLVRMRPDGLPDLIAAVALYRPGPMEGGMVDDYVNRKLGREQTPSVFPVMDEILADTYGVMVYQEQVMTVLNRVGGFELSRAYACIKSISKKKQDQVDAARGDFVAGAVANGLAAARAEAIFGMIAKFGAYGFNRAHSASYAWLAYQTGYLKAHHRAAFAAALLSSEDGNRDKMGLHVAETASSGTAVLPPDVNRSGVGFEPDGEGVRVGLSAAKGVSRDAAAAVVRARAAGPFRTVADLCARLVAAGLSRVQIESLVCAGAADPLGTPRSALLAAVAGCVSDHRRAAPGQASLFDEVEDAFALPAVPAWGVVEQLRREEDALGFYLSGHPLDAVPAPVRYVGTPLDAMPADGDVVVLGVVSDLKAAVTKSGKKFARFRVASRAGSVEVVCWPDELANVAHLLTDGAVLAVRGAAESRGDRPSLVLRAAATNPAAFATEAHILLDPIQHAPQDIDRIVPILRAAPGRVPVFLTVRDGSGRRAVLGTDVAVDPARLDIAAIVAVVGSDYFRLR